MRSRSLVVLSAVLVVMLISVGLAATPRVRAKESGLFYVRPEGTKGTLVAYDTMAGTERFTLPAGMLSADRSTFVATAADGDMTMLDIYDPFDGRLVRAFSFDGDWSLSGISPNGRWASITRNVTDQERVAWTKENRWETSIRVIDTESGEAIQPLELPGNFEVETISAAGNSLFLIEHRPAINADEYAIRLFNLATDTLEPYDLRAKTNTDDIMAGLAWDGIASANGRYLLTLYLNTLRDNAFIHALDLVNAYPVCIGLPSADGDMAKLKEYALVLSPNQQTVYATNPAIGVVSEVSLYDFSVKRSTHFDPRPAATDGNNPRLPTTRSVISADGSTVYFTNGRDIWVYDTAKKEIRTSYQVDGGILGLGVSEDGLRLFVATAVVPVVAIDTVSGARVSLEQRG
jgi:hypothetical protein